MKCRKNIHSHSIILLHISIYYHTLSFLISSGLPYLLELNGETRCLSESTCSGATQACFDFLSTVDMYWEGSEKGRVG